MGFDGAHEAVDGFESAAPATLDGAEGGFDAAATVIASVPGFGVVLFAGDHLLEGRQVFRVDFDATRGLLGADEGRRADHSSRLSVLVAQIAAIGVDLPQRDPNGLDERWELRGVVDGGPREFPGENGFRFGVNQGVDFEPLRAFPLRGFGKVPTSLVPREREAGGIDGGVERVFFRRATRASLSLER